MSSLLYCVKTSSEYARTTLLPTVERGFNGAGYIPYAVHRVSGGVRMVYGLVEAVAAVALGLLISSAGYLRSEEALRKEGVKIFDFAVHGVANMVRGFIETRQWVNLVFIFYDFQDEKNRLMYSRSIFGEYTHGT